MVASRPLMELLLGLVTKLRLAMRLATLLPSEFLEVSGGVAIQLNLVLVMERYLVKRWVRIGIV